MKKKIIGIFVCLLIMGSTLNIIVCDTARADVGDILFSFETPGDFKATGLACFGSLIIAGGYSSEGTPPYNQEIKIFSQSGEELFDWDFNHEGEITGIARQSIYLWILNRESDGSKKIYRYTITGQEMQVFSLNPDNDSAASGLTFADDHLYYCSCFKYGYLYINRIYKITTDGEYLFYFFAPGMEETGSNYQGLAYDNGYFWYTKDNRDKFWRLDPPLIDFSFEQTEISQTTDLAWDGEYLWAAANEGDTIYKIDVTPNTPPNKPSTPSGPSKLAAGDSGTYTTSATDPDGDQVQYRFNWGDGETSDWTDLVDSGTPASLSHSWEDPGTYDIKAQAKDSEGETSLWSDPFTVEIVGVCAGGPYYGFKGYYVQFTGSISQGTPPYTWKWDFNNDGQIDSNERNPKHTYNEPYSGKAKLTVIDGDGTSHSDTASVTIKNIPLWVDALFVLAEDITPDWDGSHLHATVPFNSDSIGILKDLDGSVPGDVDFQGEDDFSGPYDFEISYETLTLNVDMYPYEPENDEVKLSGGVDLHLETYQPFSAGGELNCGASGSFGKVGDDFEWDLSLYLNGRVEFPVLYIYAAIGPFPVSAKASLYIDGGVEFFLNSPDKFHENIYSSVTGNMGVGAKLKGGLGFVDIVSIGLYTDVGGSWEFKAPEVGGSVYDRFVVSLEFGAYAELFCVGYWEWMWYSESWPPNFKMVNNENNNNLQFIPRDYGTPLWVNNDVVLMENAFPASHPSVSSNSDGDRMMVWIQDDLQKPDHGDGLDIWYSTWSGDQWNSPNRVTNDVFLQSNPSVALLDNGHAICVFNSLNEPVGSQSVEEIAHDSEIRYCYWDGSSWAAPELIVPGGTTNDYMDSYPIIKANGNNAAVVWLCDQDANIQTVDDRKLYGSFYESSSWTDTRVISQKNVLTAPVSLAFSNNEAACAYVVDEDGILGNPQNEQQNIYVTTFSPYSQLGSTDDATIKITDGGRNGYPSVSYIDSTVPSVSWAKENFNDDDPTVDILYLDEIVTLGGSNVEIVQTNLDQLSSSSLFSGGISALGNTDSFPAVAWNDGKTLCYKRRFGGGWEDLQILHMSTEEIHQTAWDYDGSGEQIYATFIEKDNVSSLQGCKLIEADETQILAPEKPYTPQGETYCHPDTTYCYKTSTIDPTPDKQLWYYWDWGDGSNSGWVGPQPSGTINEECHSWTTPGTYTVKVKAKNKYKESPWSDSIEITVSEMNHAPTKPAITGPINGNTGTSYDYNFVSTDSDDDDIHYYVEWDDGSNSGWIGPYAANEEVTLTHKWTESGTYTIRAKAKDSKGAESGWGTLSVTMPRSRHVTNHLLIKFLEGLIDRFPLLVRLLQLPFLKSY